jgi:integrase
MPRPRNDKPRLEWRRGKWSIQYWEGGNRVRISTGTENEVRARQALADFEAELERRPLKLTVAEALDRYVTHRSEKVQAFDRLKEAAKPLRAALGHLRVDQVNQMAWDRYTAERVTRPHRLVAPEKHKPRPVSTGTLRREFNVLRAALRRAWKDGYLVKPPELEAPPDSAPRDRYLTKAEAKRLVAASKQTPHVEVFTALAVYTGARKAAMLSLKWDQVDFITGMIDYNEPGRTITAKRRAIVPMTADLREVLKHAHKVRQTDYVVEYGSKPVPHGLRWSFAKMCERAELGWRPTPHHLKHSVASWFAMAGVPIDQAADWLATDPKTLRRVYRKFDPSYLRTVASALAL